MWGVVKELIGDCGGNTRSGPRQELKGIMKDNFGAGRRGLRAGLANAYRQIRANAPNATVIVLGYPAIFEDGWRSTFCASVGPLTRGARSNLREGAEKLDAAIKGVAERFGFRFVDPREAYRNHRICSAGRDWLHGVTLERDRPAFSPSTFHPNIAGQAGFADLLVATNRDVFR